jgi:hypothetical protein
MNTLMSCSHRHNAPVDRRRSVWHNPGPPRGLRGLSRRRRPGCNRGLRGRRPASNRGATTTPADASPGHVALCRLRSQSSIDAVLKILLPRRPARKRPQRSAARAQRDRRFESKESATSVALRRGRRAPVVQGRRGGFSQRGRPSCTCASTSITSPGCSGAFSRLSA